MLCGHVAKPAEKFNPHHLLKICFRGHDAGRIYRTSLVQVDGDGRWRGANIFDVLHPPKTSDWPRTGVQVCLISVSHIFALLLTYQQGNNVLFYDKKKSVAW